MTSTDVTPYSDTLPSTGPWRLPARLLASAVAAIRDVGEWRPGEVDAYGEDLVAEVRSLDDPALLTVRDMARTLQAAATAVTRLVEAEMGGRLATRDWRVGDRLLRFRPRRTERIVDPQALAEFLADDYPLVVPLTPSTTIRKGALDAVAERRGIDPATVRDTFLQVDEGDPALEEVPISRAPKFAARMRDGEYRDRPTRQEVTE